MLKELYIHCGLHKTGTTSLQETLFHNRDALRAGCVLYPRAGTVYTGQHNLAWELCRDRRFHPNYGDAAAFIAEAAAFDGKIVASSEDFESSLLHPERMEKLARILARCGAQPVFVVYLRDPADYLQSIFIEKVKSGLGTEFSLIAGTALSGGRFDFREWELIFDQPRLEDVMAGIPGSRTIVRNYHALADGSIIADFAQTVDIPLELLPNMQHARRNTRDELSASLARFVLNRVPQAKPAKEALGYVSAALLGDSPLAGLAPELQLAIRTRYARVAAEPRPSNRPPTTRTYDMARLFSFETAILVVQSLETVTREGIGENPAAMQLRLAGRISEWQGWAALPDAAAAQELKRA